jgi:hypothetical protein
MLSIIGEMRFMLPAGTAEGGIQDDQCTNREDLHARHAAAACRR